MSCYEAEQLSEILVNESPGNRWDFGFYLESYVSRTPFF